jgi:competence protein ComEC
VGSESPGKRRIDPSATAALALVAGLVGGEAGLRGAGSILPGAAACLLAGAWLAAGALRRVRSRPAGAGKVDGRLAQAAGPAMLLLIAGVGLSLGSERGCAWEKSQQRLLAVAGEAWVEVRFRGLAQRLAPLDLRAARPARARGRPVRFDPPLRLALPGSLSAADSIAVLRSPGLVWEGFARLDPGRPPRGPGGWDERRFLRSRGVVGFLRSAELRPVGLPSGPGRGARPAVWLAAGLGRVRDRLARTIRERLGGDPGRLATSFLLGARSVDPEGRSRLGAFARAGVAHLLAVSGLHVALIGAAAAMLLGVLPIGWRARSLALGLAIAAYASLVGWSESVTRAAASGLLWALLRAAGRRPDARSLLLLVLAVVLTLRPAAWRDPGLRLSYVVTLALLGAARARAPRRTRWALACLAAQSAAWPLVLGHQGSGSPLFLASNALLVPVSGLVPACVIIGLAGAALPGFPAEVTLAPARLFLRLFLALVRATAALCDGVPLGSELPPEAALGASVAIALAWNLPRLRTRLRVAAMVALCVGTTAIGLPPGRTPAILMLDVGQGESWLIVWKRETWLIDAGPTPGNGDRPPTAIAPALRSYGRRDVTRLFLTHDDEDHTGGLAELRAQDVPVRTLHPPAGWRPGAATLDFMARAGVGGARIAPLQRGDTLRTAEAMVVVENPDPAIAGGGDNERSLVLRIETAGLTLLVAGDAPSSVLTRCARPSAGAVMLSAGHHGSAGSTPEELLRRMRPSTVLVSVGRGNRFGHPSPVVLDRVERAGAAVARTDRDGTIVLERRGGRWRALAGAP